MLFHYSECADKTFCRHSTSGDNAHKPGGLWLSDDSDYGWAAFVLDRLRAGDRDWSDGKELLRYKYGFKLDPLQSDQVLRLKTPDDLRRFTSHYREASVRACVVDGKRGCGLHIDWKRVKADYMGILITPYQKELSYQKPEGLHWYRFDCASGCFWDTACLTQVRKGIKTNL